MKKRNIVHLPEELVMEILSRVPTVSLARLRSTSKEWNGVIKDAKFSKKHYANASRQSHLVIMLTDFRLCLVSVSHYRVDNDKVAPSAKVTYQFSLKDPLCNSSEEVDISNAFHCDGLLLCTTKDNRLVVWNPCSRETRWIQPKNRYKNLDIYALGYDKKSSSYKILMMDRFGAGLFGAEYEIYDFTTNSWRAVLDVTTDWFIQRDWSCGVSVEGITYWLAFNQQCDVILLSFDFSTERFQSLPLHHPRPYGVLALSVVRDDLCLIMLTHMDKSAFDIDVWVTTKIEGSRVISWSKFLTAKANNEFSWWMSFLADGLNKVVPGVSNNSFLHIMGEDKYIQVDQHREAPECPLRYLLTYVPSLVQCQQEI